MARRFADDGDAATQGVTSADYDLTKAIEELASGGAAKKREESTLEGTTEGEGSPQPGRKDAPDLVHKCFASKSVFKVNPGLQGWKRLNAEFANSRLALVACLATGLDSGTVLSSSGADSVHLRASSTRRAAKSDSTTEDVLDYEWDDDTYETPEPKPFDPRDEPGVCAPLGYFDPLGFSKIGEEDTFRNYRCAELKHGRIAMMASIGAIAQHYVRLPGFDLVRNNSIDQIFKEAFRAPGVYSFTLLTLLVLVFELNFWLQLPDREPGNFGDPLGVGMYDREMRDRELNNGRFAMFAASGILAAQSLTGKDAVEQLGF